MSCAGTLGLRGGPESEFKVPLWPVASWAAVAFVLLVIVVLGIIPDTRMALVIGVGWLLLLGIGYLFIDEPEANARKAAAFAEAGTTELKLKVGRDFAQDHDTIAAIRDVVDGVLLSWEWDRCASARIVRRCANG